MHQNLITKLESDYDGFALCLAHDNLQTILPMFKTKVKICIWYKWSLPGRSVIVNNFEPVIIKVPSSRKGAKKGFTTPDVLVCRTRDGMGFAGRKPLAFCNWVLNLMQYKNGDELHDLFPGTNGMAEAIASRNE
jgi:hypothetical protein